MKKFLSTLIAISILSGITGTAYASETDETDSQITYSIGDANFDGNVNAIDATLALRDYSAHALEKAPVLYDVARDFADIDGDLNVTAIDATRILEYYAYTSLGGKKSIHEKTRESVKKQLILSGNSEDVYVTEKPEYIETDNFILFLDKGITVKGNTIELIQNLYDKVEETTGLKFNEKKYIDDKSSYEYTCHTYFYEDSFKGMRLMDEKIIICVVDEKKAAPYNFIHEIIINPIDLEIEEGEGYALVHEMIHSAHLTNGSSFWTPLTEGYATYMTDMVIKNSKDLKFNFNSQNNYSFYETEITKENAKSEFIREKDDSFENYLYGYRFVTYLHEVYGENIFHEILKNGIKNPYDDEQYGIVDFDGEQTAKLIIKTTSENVFEDFAVWLKENSARFEYVSTEKESELS